MAKNRENIGWLNQYFPLGNAIEFPSMNLQAA
jgi:hypothetical protein